MDYEYRRKTSGSGKESEFLSDIPTGIRLKRESKDKESDLQIKAPSHTSPFLLASYAL
jgi:hypothetical protein